MARMVGSPTVVQQPQSKPSGPLGIGSLLGGISSIFGLGIPAEMITGISFADALLGGYSPSQAMDYAMGGTKSQQSTNNGSIQTQQVDTNEEKTDNKENESDQEADYAGGVKPGETNTNIDQPLPVSFHPPMMFNPYWWYYMG